MIGQPRGTSGGGVCGANEAESESATQNTRASTSHLPCSLAFGPAKWPLGRTFLASEAFLPFSLEPAGISHCIEPGLPISRSFQSAFSREPSCKGDDHRLVHRTVALPSTLGRRIPAQELCGSSRHFCLYPSTLLPNSTSKSRHSLAAAPRTSGLSPRPRFAVTATLRPLLAAPSGATRPGSLEPSPSEASRPP